MPYGLVYWDELDGCELARVSPGVEAKLIQGELVFLRLNLAGEPTKVELELRRKRT